MPPIVSCHLRSYGRHGLRAAADHLPSVKIRHIELPVETAEATSGSGPILTATSSVDDVRAIRQIIADAGLSVSSCDVTGGNLADPAVLDQVKRKLDVAAQFAVPVVVGPAGNPGDDRDALVKLHQHLADLGDYAAERGMLYCLATEPGICRDHRLMLETMQALAHPNIRLSFDPAELHALNAQITSEISLAKVCHVVRHVRLTDSQGEYGHRDLAPLGFGGAVDFLRVLQLTRDCGFEGPYTIDVTPPAGAPLQECQRRIKKSVQHLKSLGYFAR